MKHILVTGSSGLIGAALVDHFRQQGVAVTGVDVRPAQTTDIVQRLTPDMNMARLLADYSGVIHLAGVSRVVWGQRDPMTCWNDNVRNTVALIDAARQMAAPPWLVYASSREVYGQVTHLPLIDDTPIAPLNIYACSKAASEMLVEQAVKTGQLRGAVIRLSTVYGGLNDHPDRVIPAFMQAVIKNASITVFGKEVALDPTWLGDVVDGIYRLSIALDQGLVPQRAILFSGGKLVRLLDMAKMLRETMNASSIISIEPARTYDVEKFAGIPQYASELLGWAPSTPLALGLRLYAEMLGAKLSV